MVIICLMLTHLGCTYIPHTFSVIFLSGGLCPTGTCPGKFEQEAFVQGGFCPGGFVLGEHLSQGGGCLRGAFVQEVFPGFLVHLDQRSMGTIAITCRPSSVNFSHFKLLLRNHWANWNQAQQECSLDGPLQSFCFSFQSDIQHGCQG